jgi:hypothetical protein
LAPSPIRVICSGRSRPRQCECGQYPLA